MKFSKRALKAALGATALSTVLMSGAYAQTVNITILGVGDLYNFADKHGQGGVARLNAVALAERAANPNFLYVFDGDMLSPSILSGFDHGQNMIDLTNQVPFDIAVPGNHEFDFGVNNFIEKMAVSAYPWAAVNVTNADGSTVVGMTGTMMKEFDGVKVALVPVAQDTTPEVTSSGDLVFGGTVEMGVAAANAAREEGADIVIGVVQTDMSNDRLLIRSGAFDVVISGDDHSYATSYDGRTAYVETSIDGRFLSPIDLEVTIGEKRGKRHISWTPNFRFIDTADVTPDPDTQAMVDEFTTQLDESLNVEIGATDGPLDSRRNSVRGQETAIGNLVADAMRAATGADVAMANGGGIRADREYEAGTMLTRRDILTELPFGNVTVMTEITGAQILAAMENGVSKVEDGSGRFPQISGMSIVYDPTAPAGSRIVKLMIGENEVDLNATYKFATNNYAMGGGDGYGMLGGGRMLIDTGNGNLMANDVINYVIEQGGVHNTVEGRIKVVGE